MLRLPQSLAYPSLDGSLLLHEFVDFHLQYNADHPFFVYADEHELLHEISHLEFARAVHRAAYSVDHLPRGTPIAVIAFVDTVYYHALFMGLMKAGYVPVLISHRNSAVATAKLLRDVNCSQILTTYTTLKSLIEEVRTDLASTEIELKIHEVPRLDLIFPKLSKERADDPFEEYLPKSRARLTDVAFYLHSSGSTGFPKPIPQTQTSILHWCIFQSVGDLRNHVPALQIAAHMLPPFHTLGVYYQLLTPLTGLRVIGVSQPLCVTPDSLPYTPSPGSLLHLANLTKCNSLVAIPAILEIWSTIPEAVSFLQKLSFVWFSGGTLSAKVGKSLYDQGVILASVYGATEFGCPCHVIPADDEIKTGEWEWIRFDSRASIRWIPRGNDLFEAHFLTSSRHALTVENLPDVHGYASSDVFLRHPTKELWKVAARLDDVIVLSSGEKAVPGPLEDIVNCSPFVSCSLMFGREQHQVGIIVQPKQEVDVSDEKAVSDFIDKIWPSIEEANRAAPAFARIYRDMIIVVSAYKPLTKNSKGSVNRKPSLQAFENEILALYSGIKSNSGSTVSVPLPSAWTVDGLKPWFAELASQIQGREITLLGDLFEQGFDSLSTSLLRNRVIAAVRLSPLEDVRTCADRIGADWIYSNPTVTRLSTSLSKMIGLEPFTEDSTSDLQSMLKNYSLPSPAQGVDATPTKLEATTPRVVLLTGSTGALGSHLLSLLVQSPTVQFIYCLNRASSGKNIQDRQRQGFLSQGLDATLLQSDKIVLYEGDVTKPGLGLDDDVLKKLRATVNVIIHSAWRVDFKLTLPSFEPQIKATKNLIDFAWESKYSRSTRFLFVSSVASVQSWDKALGAVPETIIEDASVAAGRGYGESKYVAERIISNSSLCSTSLRVGQLTGGFPNGAWAPTEWFPILVKSSLAIGALPAFSGVVSWIPMHDAAKTILDLSLSVEAEPILNLVHPRPVKWWEVINWVRDALDKTFSGEGMDELPIVSPREWLAALEERADAPTSEDFDAVPALKLLSYFQDLVHADTALNLDEGSLEEAGGLAAFSTSKAEQCSETMTNLSRLGTESAEAWVKYWRNVGFIE